MMVDRCNGTISLKITNTIQSEEEARVVRSSKELAAELDELKLESSRVLRRQVTVGVVGSLCGIVFGYFTATNLLEKDLPTGLTMLVCAAGAFWFVRFVMRDSTMAGEVIAKRTMQIETELLDTQKLDNQRMAVEKLGLDRVALELYLKEVKFYPSWIQHSRARVPAQISEATKAGADAVLLKTSRTEYLFEWECNPIADGRDRGELTLWSNGCIVLRVRGMVSHDQWLTSASSYEVREFVGGSWVDELFGIWTESKQCRQQKLS
jgi:hypothetical protein